MASLVTICECRLNTNAKGGTQYPAPGRTYQVQMSRDRTKNRLPNTLVEKVGGGGLNNFKVGKTNYTFDFFLF